jgi:5-methylcytosine-specific restriction endonuclease McrA
MSFDLPTSGIFSPIKSPGSTKDTSNQSKLTPARSSKIRYLIDKCETPNCKNGSSHVHHIKPKSEEGPDTPGNLIVLCSIHHDKAHGKSADGIITSRTTLKSYVAKRSKTKNDHIKAILKGTRQ